MRPHRASLIGTGISLLMLLVSLPVAVVFTTLLDDLLRPQLSWRSTRYAEFAGFALAGVMLLTGWITGTIARRRLRREPGGPWLKHSAIVGKWLNAAGLALVLYIVFVLNGRW